MKATRASYFQSLHESVPICLITRLNLRCLVKKQIFQAPPLKLLGSRLEDGAWECNFLQALLSQSSDQPCLRNGALTPQCLLGNQFYCIPKPRKFWQLEGRMMEGTEDLPLKRAGSLEPQQQHQSMRLQLHYCLQDTLPLLAPSHINKLSVA